MKAGSDIHEEIVYVKTKQILRSKLPKDVLVLLL